MSVINKRKLSETIVNFCKACAPDHDIDQCEDIKCPLFEFRYGSCGRKGVTGLLKAIRRRCCECMSGCEVRPDILHICSATKCSLWPWRMGKKKPEVADTLGEKTWNMLFSDEESDETLNVLFGDD